MKRRRFRKYPFDQLAIDDFFFVPHRTANTLTAYSWKVGKHLGMTFSTRLCWMKIMDGRWIGCSPYEEDSVRGIGVWRVA
jgi:hypothetical protein